MPRATQSEYLAKLEAQLEAARLKLEQKKAKDKEERATRIEALILKKESKEQAFDRRIADLTEAHAKAQAKLDAQIAALQEELGDDAATG